MTPPGEGWGFFYSPSRYLSRAAFNTAFTVSPRSSHTAFTLAAYSFLTLTASIVICSLMYLLFALRWASVSAIISPPEILYHASAWFDHVQIAQTKRRKVGRNAA
nr:MAG TPA: hypothetical protein [Caudoviricetes sp.]